MTDPFAQIPIPADRDTFVKLAYLAAVAREKQIQFMNVSGWILPLLDAPWTPQRATELRRIIHHTERCRGCLQANASVFPTMTQDLAEEWRVTMAQHHGRAFPSWWAPGVVEIARQIINLAEV